MSRRAAVGQKLRGIRGAPAAQPQVVPPGSARRPRRTARPGSGRGAGRAETSSQPVVAPPACPPRLAGPCRGRRRGTRPLEPGSLPATPIGAGHRGRHPGPGLAGLAGGRRPRSTDARSRPRWPWMPRQDWATGSRARSSWRSPSRRRPDRLWPTRPTRRPTTSCSTTPPRRIGSSGGSVATPWPPFALRRRRCFGRGSRAGLLAWRSSGCSSSRQSSSSRTRRMRSSPNSNRSAKQPNDRRRRSTGSRRSSRIRGRTPTIPGPGWRRSCETWRSNSASARTTSTSTSPGS